MRYPMVLLMVSAVACSRPKPDAEPIAESASSHAPASPPASSVAGTPQERAGAQAASGDLARGVLGFREAGGYGYSDGPPVKRYSIGRILQRDFDVSLVTDPPDVEGCRRDPDYAEKSEFNRGYNAVMVPEIRKRHGALVLYVAEERAKKENERIDDLVKQCREGKDSACDDLGSAGEMMKLERDPGF